MNEMFRISDFPVDIDPVWAGDGSHLPEWFVSALKVPREEGYVEIDGAKAHYFRWGDPSKPKVLMTHGFLAHARCFAFIRSEEHTSELQSLMRISYAVFCLTKKTIPHITHYEV